MKNKYKRSKVDENLLPNAIQQRLNLLYDNSYSDNDIIALTSLNKKVIKDIAKDKYFQCKNEEEKFCKILDKLIARLKITSSTFFAGPFPEDNFDLTNFYSTNIINADLLTYKSVRDKNLVCQINKVIYKLFQPDATLNVRKDGKRAILIIRGEIDPNLTLSEGRIS
jgi:hypothetical protein